MGPKGPEIHTSLDVVRQALTPETQAERVRMAVVSVLAALSIALISIASEKKPAPAKETHDAVASVVEHSNK